MKPFTFGRGVEKARTLETTKVGEEIAILDSRGNFMRMDIVKKRTEKSLWTGKTALQARFSFDGKCLNGRGTARVPTHNDRKAWTKKKADRAEFQMEADRLDAVRANPEYSIARDIGYELCDSPVTSDPDTYLAFAKLIGIERLKQMQTWIEEAKNGMVKAPAKTVARKRIGNPRVRRLSNVDKGIQALPVS